MANLTPTAAWSDVYKIETSDLVIGGANTAICNKQAQSIINRIEYLKNMIDAFEVQVNNLDDPLKMIKLWYGSAASVPTGWQICNGTNGTPDLRNKFVAQTISSGSTVYVSQVSNINFNVDSIGLGYAGTHIHDAFGLSYAGSHSHSGTSGVVDTGTGAQGYEWRGGGGACSSNGHKHPITTSYSGSHTHTVTFSAAPTHKHFVNRIFMRGSEVPNPPNRKIYYIMRVS
jgi:hypothetical protein